MPEVIKICCKCSKGKQSSKFPKNNNGERKSKICTQCLSKSNWDKMSREKQMLHTSYCNAKRRGIIHTIKVGDLKFPTHCKYLGIKLDYSRSGKRDRYGPSLDRIDSSLGYIPGNVQIISDLANSMKQNATVQELLLFAHGIIKLHG